MPSKQVWAWGVAILAILAALWYRSKVLVPQPMPEVRIAFVTGGSEPYWQLIANGARAAAIDHKATVLIEMPEEDESVEQQNRILADLDLASLDGVAVSPLDAEGQTELIDRLAQDVFVVTFDSDAPKSKRVSYVGTSNIQAGRRAARLVHEAIPKGGQVVVALANLTKDNMIERRAGFEEAIAAPPVGDDGEPSNALFEVVEFLVDEGDDDRCRELTAKALADHPDVACLVGMNARHGGVFLDVLRDAGKLGEVALVVFDERDETLAGVEAGHIYATVVQDPYLYGYEAVRSLTELCRGSESQRPLAGSFSTYSIATASVTKNNLAAYRRELAERLKPGVRAADSSANK